MFLPELASYIDASSLVFVDKEVFTDVTSGERHEADLVVRAKLKDADSFFLIHIETQAHAEEEFPRRMFKYFARLYERFAVPVYPIVVFSFDVPRRKQPASHRVSFPDLKVLEFRYRVIQLNRLNWRDFLRQKNPIAGALMAKMNIAPEDRVRVKLECLRLLATLRLDRARAQLISGFVDTYLRLEGDEENRFRAAIEHLRIREKERVMEIVTSWMQEGIEKGLKQGLEQGREQGREQGLEQGREQGKQKMLLLVTRLLEKRFGQIGQDWVQRISGLTLDQLESLGESLIDFSTREEVAQWLEANSVK